MSEEIILEDGKYRVRLTEQPWSFTALRYGEEWRNLAGDKLVLAMFNRIQELETVKHFSQQMLMWLDKEKVEIRHSRPLAFEPKVSLFVPETGIWYNGKDFKEAIIRAFNDIK